MPNKSQQAADSEPKDNAAEDAQDQRLPVLNILLGVMAVIELLLWAVGHTNPFGLYLGAVLGLGAAVAAVLHFRESGTK